MLSKKDYESKPEDGKLSKAEAQWQEAEEQIKRYAAAPRVEALRQGTTLHKIIMQFVAGKLVRMEEVGRCPETGVIMRRWTLNC